MLSRLSPTLTGFNLNDPSNSSCMSMLDMRVYTFSYSSMNQTWVLTCIIRAGKRGVVFTTFTVTSANGSYILIFTK